MRARLVVSLALVLGAAVVLPALPAAAQTPDQDAKAAERAARQIEDAQNRAHAAAAALAKAETQVATVEAERQQLEAVQRTTQERMDTARTNLSRLALQRYVRGDASSIPLSSTAEDLTAQVRADVMLRLFALGSTDAVDEFQRVGQDLDSQAKRLAQLAKQSAKSVAALDTARRQLDRRIGELKVTEEKRQNDAAVRRVLEARRAERLRQEEATAEAEAKAAAARAAAAGSRSASSGSGTAGRPAARPSPRPAAPSAAGMTCPVAGASAYVDSWGAPRSGGRRHEGVDMLGARGTPIVAVVDGSVQHKQSSLGGLTAWLTGANGFKYFYGHFDSFGAAGSVSRGTVIGYMGDTGNARGTVHLHFEVHPGGGRAVNPTPYVRAVC